MRELLLLLCLTPLISASFANETHTPNYRCEDSRGNVKYLLTGNKFYQGEGMDWSSEVILATAKQYLGCDGAGNKIKFSLQKQKGNNYISTYGNFFTYVNELSDGNRVWLELVEGEKLKETYSQGITNELGEHQYQFTYECARQLGIDGGISCNE